jgi:hypothetical protein
LKDGVEPEREGVDAERDGVSDDANNEGVYGTPEIGVGRASECRTELLGRRSCEP